MWVKNVYKSIQSKYGKVADDDANADADGLKLKLKLFNPKKELPEKFTTKAKLLKSFKTKYDTKLHDWKVNVKTLLDENCFFAPFSFQAGETIGLDSKWQFYARVCTEEGKHYVGLYLRCLTRNEFTHLNACFKTTLVHNTDPLKNVVYDGVPQDFTTVDSWGMKRLLDLESLKDYINENWELTFKINFVLCNATHEMDSITQLQKGSMEACSENIMAAINGMESHDILIKPKNDDVNPIQAHKLILTARSKFFRKMIEDITAGNQIDDVDTTGQYPVVNVDLSSVALGHLLCYIYHGCLNHLPEKCSAETARELVKAADEHGLELLEYFLKKHHPGLKEPEEGEPMELGEPEGSAKENNEGGEGEADEGKDGDGKEGGDTKADGGDDKAGGGEGGEGKEREEAKADGGGEGEKQSCNCCGK
ncbi:unnamed protein product [Orchesella dallaii]|uniref:BTB domain-containing protein n=1 Tax=Orchesella dallaii TaxID=48710 RepID=A0ABP1RXW2_9HEXA